MRDECEDVYFFFLSLGAGFVCAPLRGHSTSHTHTPCGWQDRHQESVSCVMGSFHKKSLDAHHVEQEGKPRGLS